jgi:hypothetical protein
MYFKLNYYFKRYEATWLVQLLYLIKRSYMNYYRNRRVVLYDLAMTVITAIIGGLIYYQLSNEVNGVCTFSQKSISNVSRALFFSLTFVVVVSLLSAVIVSSLLLDFADSISIYAPIFFFADISF